MFSLHPRRSHGIQICSITDGVDFVRLVKVGSSLHCEVTIFPSKIQKCFVGLVF